jgi:hypothetical protein
MSFRRPCPWVVVPAIIISLILTLAVMFYVSHLVNEVYGFSRPTFHRWTTPLLLPRK